MGDAWGVARGGGGALADRLTHWEIGDGAPLRMLPPLLVGRLRLGAPWWWGLGGQAVIANAVPGNGSVLAQAVQAWAGGRRRAVLVSCSGVVFHFSAVAVSRRTFTLPLMAPPFQAHARPVRMPRLAPRAPGTCKWCKLGGHHNYRAHACLLNATSLIHKCDEAGWRIRKRCRWVLRLDCCIL